MGLLSLLILLTNYLSYNLDSELISAYVSNYQNMRSEELCLASTIYHESRNQSIIGQYAVADVTINRVKHDKYPDNICDVISQPHQYSWYRGKRRLIPNTTNTISKVAWRKAILIAKISLNTPNVVFDESVIYFHSVDVKPSWSKHMVFVAKIEDHIFYSETSQN